MPAQRTFETFSSHSSLDFPLESKAGFSANESTINLVAPLFVGIVCAMAIHGLAILVMVPAYFITPRIMLRMKKNKPRSWMRDGIHRMGLTFNTANGFRRALGTKRFIGRRMLSGSAWSNAGKASLYPNKPSHLTLGLPAIRAFDPKSKTFGESITPFDRCAKVAIYERCYRGKAAKLSAHMADALAPTEDGVRTYQMFEAALRPVSVVPRG
ncbi:MAG: hypothetical protein PF961_10540 [Planctomycetota bacterium]|jgi:hypothetical protein|nr:hypothetical protein [Planctomycetota bacterium]